MKNIVMVALLLLLSSCIQEKETAEYKEKQIPALWICTKEFPVIHYDNISTMGQICTDRKTGIKYLKIWAGMASGGPAITRYYEKNQ